MSSLIELTITTTLEMLNDRGYPPHEWVSDTKLVCVRRDEEVGGVAVRFIDQPKVSIEEVRQFANWLTNQKIERGILVIQKPPSPPIKSFILTSTNPIIEVFHSQELGMNVTKHVLVPKHTLLSKAEADETKRKYGAAKLPRICIGDAVAKYYGARLGDVFFIRRKQGCTYRIVVSDKKEK